MNNTFSTWTRSVAFSLTLTEEAIQELLFLLHGEKDCEAHGKQPKEYPYNFHGSRGLMGYLLRRGMIESSADRSGYVLSRAGRLVAEMLVEAGFTPHRTYGTMFPESIRTP